MPSGQSGSYGITEGPDGAIWFTELTGNKIGRLSASGDFKEDAFPFPGAFPSFIVAGSDGALWFTVNQGNKIGRISLDGEITEYELPTAKAGPVE